MAEPPRNITYRAASEALLAAIDEFAKVIETLPEDAALRQEPLREPSR